MERYALNGGNAELTHVRYYFKQIDMLKESLNNEQMGRLFFAVAEFARTGVRENVAGDILFPYHVLCNSVDNARNRRP